MEKTLFFVKPHVPVKDSDQIYCYLAKMLAWDKSDFNIGARQRTQTTLEFWLEFYRHMKKTYPRELEDMAREFSRDRKEIDFSIIEGENIAERVKRICGPTNYEDNPCWTIRRKWGPYQLPYTFVHAPSLEEVEENIAVFKKYGLM